MLRLASLLLGTAFWFTSCATYPVGTPSGRPEVVVHSSLERAKTVAIETMSNGYSLVSQSPNIMTFEAPLPPAQSAVFLLAVGNSYYSDPKAVIRLTFLQNGSSVKILGNVQAITQGPYGQTKSMDLTDGKGGQQVQQVLLSIQRRLGQG